MPKTQPDQRGWRKTMPVKMTVAGRAQIQALADRECEGNASMMVRKLLGEAIAARARR